MFIMYSEGVAIITKLISLCLINISIIKITININFLENFFNFDLLRSEIADKENLFSEIIHLIWCKEMANSNYTDINFFI